ncbi:hypothetical protein Plhal703r1_c27g0111051 [Plasmopara halstedii]
MSGAAEGNPLAGGPRELSLLCVRRHVDSLLPSSVRPAGIIQNLNKLPKLRRLTVARGTSCGSQLCRCPRIEGGIATRSGRNAAPPTTERPHLTD